MDTLPPTKHHEEENIAVMSYASSADLRPRGPSHDGPVAQIFSRLMFIMMFLPIVAAAVYIFILLISGKH